MTELEQLKAENEKLRRLLQRARGYVKAHWSRMDTEISRSFLEQIDAALKEPNEN